MRTRSRMVQGLALLLVLAMAGPQLLQARYKPSSGFNLFSRQQEIDVGQQTAADVAKKLPLLSESDPMTRYVQRLGGRLAEFAPGEKWPYSFQVVNQKEINAFALPGGPVYVNLGTIQAADNEAQLAGVLAHEISHVVQRHATRAATKQMEAQIPLAILGGLLGRGMGAELARLGISFGVGSYFLKNSRQAESEADLVGADIMYDAGYDPRQMALFFQKLEKEGGPRGPQFLSDHPNPGNRMEAVSKEVATLPPKKFSTDSADFRNIKQEAAGMKPLTGQQIAQQQKQQGGTIGTLSREEVRPSETFRRFDHNLYTLRYPENWQVFGDQHSAVTIAPKAGVAENAVAYGVIISGFNPEQGRGSLDEATHQLIDSLRQANPELKVVGRDENIRVNGVPGKSVDMIGPSPIKDASGRPQRERDWLVTLGRSDGSILYLVFISTEKDFDQLRPTFESMLRSLRMN